MTSNYYPEVRRLLEQRGCKLVRQGKGSHEIWHSELSKRNFTVPSKLRKKTTANGVRKDAGLPKAF